MKWTNKSDKNMTAELQEDGQVLLIPQGFKVPRASMIMNQWHEVKEEQSLLLKDLNGKKFVFECQTQSELDSIWNICKLTGDAYSWNESNPCFRAWKSDYDFHAPYSLNDKTSTTRTSCNRNLRNIWLCKWRRAINQGILKSC